MDVAKSLPAGHGPLAQCGDREAARQAMGSLANLAEDMHTHTHVARLRRRKHAWSRLVDHDAVDIHREASRAIANLLTSFHHQATIISGCPGWSTWLWDPARSASTTLLSVSGNSRRTATRTKGIMEHGGLEALFQLLEIKD